MKHHYVAIAIAALALPAGAAVLAAEMPMAADVAVKHAQGRGVIKAVDSKARTITIAHGAIPALGWPPMTMTFAVAPKLSLSTVKPGDKIAFGLDAKGMSGVVTNVQPE